MGVKTGELAPEGGSKEGNLGCQILIIVQEAATTPREKWGYHNPGAPRRGAGISEGIATVVLGPLVGKGTPTT